mmetsp:Transcript_8429/g.15229  ORF Transcript_8429/g.15229 Transcript_8429/m.15229 type:complete len:175 (-) Transcript_8429:63-587(-)
MLFPPVNFGVVNEGLYRGALPAEINMPFLETLELRTIVILESGPTEDLDPTIVEFLDDNQIELIRLSEDEASVMQTMQSKMKMQAVSEDVVLRAMNVVVEESKYPMMIADVYGKHRTGTVVACLRKLQRWNLASVFEEYRRFAGNKRRLQNEQFIELFDIDLVNEPPTAVAFLR